MMEIMDVYGLECPICHKGKLSEAKRYKEGSDPRIRVYERVCDNPECQAALDEVKAVARTLKNTNVGETPYTSLS